MSSPDIRVGADPRSSNPTRASSLRSAPSAPLDWAYGPWTEGRYDREDALPVSVGEDGGNQIEAHGLVQPARHRPRGLFALPPREARAKLAVQQLETAGVIRRINTGKRNRAWEAVGLFELVDSGERRLRGRAAA
jgi:hypothetical protein